MYEAFDRDTKARVALKTLRAMTPETLLVLKNEFRSVADLHHPNLVQLGELFEENGQWFLTMEFVPGADFLAYVCPDGASELAVGGEGERAPCRRYDEGRLRQGLRQLVLAVAALHAAGKAHRDVKPTNVLVTPEGRVVLLDFGVASDFSCDARPSPGFAGTALTMAPEQVACEAVGPPADWYGLGVILYRALTGRYPFDGQVNRILEDKLTREPPPPGAGGADLPDDLAALCVDLLRMDPLARPGAKEILERLRGEDAPAGGAASSPRLQAFIGRKKELHALEQAYRDARRGTVTVLVEGESGVGKTYFVRRFFDRILAGDPGALLVAGRCYERESVPYKAIDGLIDDLCLFLRDLPDDEAGALLPPGTVLLADVFPVLKQVEVVAALAAQPREPLNAQESRARMFLAVRELLARIATTRPLMVFIDDLQWADADSRALLANVLRPPANPPVLLVATRRRSTKRRPDEETLPGDVRVVGLERLSPREARELAQTLLGPEGPAETALDVTAIASESGGHPMFIEELVRQREAGGPRSGGALRLDDALWSRVERLDAAARHLLEAVAIAGLPLSQEIVAHAAAVELGHLLPLLASLRAGHLVKTSGARRDDVIEPYHDRVREAVLAHLDPSTRRDWHGRLALALERWRDKADPEALAVHWREAGSPARAVEYAALAADRAAAALAFDRAVRLHGLAIELYGKDDETSIGYRLKRAEALTNGGRRAEAADERLALASGVGAVASLELRRIAAEQLLCSGYFDRGVEVLQEVLRASAVRSPRGGVATLARLLFVRLLLALRGLRFQERAADDAPLRDRIRVDASFSAGCGFSMTDHTRGSYFQALSLLLALRLGDPHRIVRSLGYETCFSSGQGTRSVTRTRRLLAAAETLRDRLATPEARSGYAVGRGYHHYMLGEWPAAKEWLEGAEAILRDQCVGVAFQLQTVRLMLYRVLVYLGDLRDMSARVAPVLREVLDQGDIYSEIGLRAGPLMVLGFAADEAARVKNDVERAKARLPRTRFVVQNYFCLLAQSQVDLYLGEAHRGLERFTSTWPALRRSMLLRLQVIRIMAWDQRARLLVAVAQTSKGSKERARLLVAAEKDVARILRENVPWTTPLASLLQAAVARLRDDRLTAVVELGRAALGFRRASMGLHAAAADWLRGHLLGGPAGADLLGEATTTLAREGVKRPACFAGMLGPGILDDDA